MANRFLDLLGTVKSTFRVGLTGFTLKNSSGNAQIRNAGDSAFAELTASKVNISGEDLVINSDAAGSGADWTYTLRRPASGMAAAVLLTLPDNDGAPGEALVSDGSGVLSWDTISGSAPANIILFDSTNLAFGDASPKAMFSTPASATNIIKAIHVVVDTAFNGAAPQLSIGIAGNTAKYAPATEIDLKTAGIYSFTPLALSNNEALIGTYVADSSSAGAARIIVEYGEPS